MCEVLFRECTNASLPPDVNQSLLKWPLRHSYLVSVICEWVHCWVPKEDVKRSHHWLLPRFCCGRDPHSLANIFQRDVVSWWILDEVQEDLFPTFYRHNEFRLNQKQFSTVISPAVAIHHNSRLHEEGSESEFLQKLRESSNLWEHWLKVSDWLTHWTYTVLRCPLEERVRTTRH